MSKPRICILGTSNGVFADGYVRALTGSGEFDQVKNLSVGYCSSSLFAYRQNDLAFSDYDVCLLDFACNDASLELAGNHAVDAIAAQLQDAIATVSGAGCLPVLLVLPVRWCISGGQRVRHIYRDVAKQCQIPFYDAYELLGLLERHGIPAEEMFLDDMHLRLDVAYEFGQVISGSLVELLAMAKEQTPISLESHRHRCVGVASLFSDKVSVEDRSTSILAAQSADIDASSISCLCDAGDEIVAIAADFSRSCGVLHIEGRTRISIRLTNDYFAPETARLVFGIWPIQPPLRIDDGRFTLRVTEDARADINCSERALVSAPPKASLVALIFRHHAMLHVQPFFPEAVDVIQRVNPAYLDLLVERVRSKPIPDHGVEERPEDLAAFLTDRSCSMCGWPVIELRCIGSLSQTPPFSGHGTWVYCSNKICALHTGQPGDDLQAIGWIR